jgi:hypothetical protein
MRYVKCGSKLFRPDAVTAVDLKFSPYSAEVKVVVPGDTLFFRDAEAEAVRAYFLSIHATDLMLRNEDEAPEQVATNHSTGEC